MTTRRDFIKQVSLIGAGLTFSPFYIRSNVNTVSANDKIHVGLIGCNGMGFEDLKAFVRNPEVECIALADIDDNVLNTRAADLQKITGKKVKNLYKDWRKLIDNKDIDVVIVGTPDHWHCLQWWLLAKQGRMFIAKSLWATASKSAISWCVPLKNITGSGKSGSGNAVTLIGKTQWILSTAEN